MTTFDKSQDAGFTDINFVDFEVMDYDAWNHIGAECFRARLPRSLVKQALRAQARRFTANGDVVTLWHLRAFVMGLRGHTPYGDVQQEHEDHCNWPQPPDPAWEIVVCCYLSQNCEIDLVHPVSRRFFSEAMSQAEAAQVTATPYRRSWFRMMGFQIIDFDPDMLAAISHLPPKAHLSIVSK